MSLIKLTPASEEPRQCPRGMIPSWMEATKETECHDDFHYWMALAQIASAMGRRFTLDQRMFTIFPNMFIILLGESGFSGKSTAIGLAARAFKEAFESPDVPILAQKVSPSSLIGDLLRFKLANPNEHAEGTLVSSELITLLGNTSRDDEILKVLTDLWDCPNRWEYSTRSRGQEVLENVCLNLWGGSTPSWFKTGIPESNLEGGFFSRLILVDRPRSTRRIALPSISIDKSMEQHHAYFVHDLKRIFHMKGGNYTLTADAAEVYIKWYENDLDREMENAGPAMRSYFARKRTFILKIAMVLALSQSDALTIHRSHILEALAILEKNENHLSELTSYLGATKDGMDLQVLMREFIRLWKTAGKRKGENYCIKHAIVLARVSHRWGAMQLEQMIRTLAESGFLEIVNEGARGGRLYLSTPQSFVKVFRTVY